MADNLPTRARQFLTLTIRPTLLRNGLWSPAAERLLLGTALHESGGLDYIQQLPDGPALGLYQMEPATLDDLYTNGLKHHQVMLINGLMAQGATREQNLTSNNIYATIACRLQYWRFPQPLPDAADTLGLAKYWKRYWNTDHGAGTPQQFIDALEATTE